MVGLTNAWFAYAAAVSYFAPRTTIPAAVALRVRVGGHMERILMQRAMNMALDVLGEARIHFVEHVLAVIQRPHLANGFVAHPRSDPADVVQHGIHRQPLVVPVLLRVRQLQTDGVALAGLFVDVA